MTSKATKRTPAHEPDAELGHLLEDAASAPPETRIEYRDRIAAHGADAVVAMEAWVEQGRSPGFAIAVLEAVGKAADDAGAARRSAGSRPRCRTGRTLRSRRWRGSGPRAGPAPRSSPRRPRWLPATCTWPPGRRHPWKAPAPSRTATGPRATTPADTRSRAAGPARRTGRPRRARPSPRDRGCSGEHRLGGRLPCRSGGGGCPGYRRRCRRLRFGRFSPGAYFGSTDGPSMTVIGGSSSAPMAIPMIGCALTTGMPARTG